MTLDPSSAEFFEAKYAASGDPWNFETNIYERRRYDETIRALAHRRYRSAFEPGCSVGALTVRLSGLCDGITAIDISPSAVRAAHARCRHYRTVRIFQGALPEAIPHGPFDLIVFSEIGYYFRQDDLDVVLRLLLNELAPDGVFLAVHWLGRSSDHLIGGDDVHHQIQRLPQLRHEVSYRYEGTPSERYRLDRWVRL